MIGRIRALASDLVARAQLASSAGLTFSGRRDLYQALGYTRDLRVQDYRDRYARNGLAARVVESFPKATWRGGAELVQDEDPEVTTEFEQTWLDLSDKLQVWPALARTDILAGLGRYAVMLIGAPGLLEEEMPAVTVDSLLYLAPYAEDEAQIDEYVEDPEDERFGLPLFYKVARKSSGTKRGAFARRVHWSRVVHVADGVLDDRVNGTPRLERIWNWLDDLEKITGAGSEAFWLRANQGLVFNVDPDLEIGEPEKAKLKEEVEEFAHQMRRTIAARGFTVQPLDAQVANFQNQVTSVVSLISGATSIPQRILLGSERGQLASAQDKENWDERVSDRRLEFAEPIVREMVARLQGKGAVPATPDGFDIRWPEIEDLDDVQRAQIAESWSKLNKQAGGLVVLPEEIRDRVLVLPKLELTPEEMLAEEDALAPDPAPPDPNAPPQPEDEPAPPPEPAPEE